MLDLVGEHPTEVVVLWLSVERIAAAGCASRVDQTVDERHGEHKEHEQRNSTENLERVHLRRSGHRWTTRSIESGAAGISSERFRAAPTHEPSVGSVQTVTGIPGSPVVVLVDITEIIHTTLHHVPPHHVPRATVAKNDRTALSRHSRQPAREHRDKSERSPVFPARCSRSQPPLSPPDRICNRTVYLSASSTTTTAILPGPPRPSAVVACYASKGCTSCTSASDAHF